MGGEHKCPLCSATFTRPQHVGRHLRAHTGDRPYECKECPLRFARSDLLSRHVNKAHKPPDENGKPPQGKKGRRKSMPSSAQPPPPTNNGGNASTEAKLRRASMDIPRPNINDPSGSNSSNYSSMGHPSQNQQQPLQNRQPVQPPLQAQRMYPHHPLLAGTPPSQPINISAWTSSPPSAQPMAMPMYQNLSMPYSSSTNMLGQTIGPNGYASFQPPFTAVPMRISGSDQGGSTMGRGGSGQSMGSLSGMGYEFGFKKRACDQCNHSKVRCDFAEPCQRCAHRNLRCTYNKPQKSRSIPTIPNQRMPMSSTNSVLTTSLSGNSTSPQSQYSSPHSNNSPLTSTMPPPAMPASQSSQINDPNSLVYPQTHGWNPQWQSLNGQHIDPSLGSIQQNAGIIYPQTTQLGSVHSNPSSGQLGPMPLPHRDSGSSINSPQNHLAPTPSLTSHSTSPSSSDEPAERRQSSNSYGHPSGWMDPKAKNVDPGLTGEGYMASSVSPTTSNSVINVPPAVSYQPDMNNVFAWAPPVTATIDPRLQFRGSIGTDEEDAGQQSRPGSSSASTYYEQLDESILNALNQKRRSSTTTGVWANAFNQMSLHDPTSAIPADPYTASQIAQASTRRPSFPMMPTGLNESSHKVPSAGNVNELWKLFMAEPMSATMGHSSSTDYIDPAMNAAITPRPTLGFRGLSKSNSMPDLTSPLNGNQQFFSSGITPKPTKPQGSYTQPQDPDDNAAAEDQGEEVITMKRWKDSIKTRQASFEFGPNVPTKLKSTSPPNTNAMSPPNSRSVDDSILNLSSMAAAAGHNGNRPLASVLQHSSALQQTLAPERVPSFGMDNLPTPTKNAWMSRQNAAKFTSALTRPGNKRLASQTLVPAETGKKVELDGWEGNDQAGSQMTGGGYDAGAGGMDSRGFSMPHGLGGLGTGMTPNVVGGNQYFVWNNPAPSAT